MALPGTRILVTRGGTQADEFGRSVRARGGVPVLFPTVALVPVEEGGDFDDSLRRLDSYDFVVFTSANAVRFVRDRMTTLGVRRLPDTLSVVSVGPGTTRELNLRYLPVHLEAPVHSAEGVVDLLVPKGVVGKRVLFPRAEEGREVIPDGLTAAGATVDLVVAYRNGLPPKDPQAAARIVDNPPEVSTFASPSAFRNLFHLLGEEKAAAFLSKSVIAVIGDVTAAAVREKGFEPAIVPTDFTLDAMLDAIERKMLQISDPPKEIDR